MRKWLRRILGVAAAVGMLAAAVWAFRPQPVLVDAAPVVRGPLEVTVDEDGRTRIRERYVVSAPLNGRVQRITLDPGDPVVRDSTVVATIEPSDPSLLDERALAEARARVHAADAAVKRATALVERAKVTLDRAESELGRLQRLAATNAVTADQVEQAQLAFRAAGRDYQASLFSREIAEFERELARAALIRSGGDGDIVEPQFDPESPSGTSSADPAELDTSPQLPPPSDDAAADPPGAAAAGSGNDGSGQASVAPGTSRRLSRASAEHLVIRAPITGQVLRVFEENSRVVSPGTPLLELGDARDLELEVDVLSSDAVRVRPGQAVRIDQWGGSGELNGVVRLVEPSAFTKISALGVEEQRVNVIIDLTDPQEERAGLGDAFRVEAHIVVDRRENALKVPASAVFRSQRGWSVFRIGADGTAEETPVEIGLRNGEEVEIRSGLNEGAAVVEYPGDRIQHGTRVARRQ